MLPHDGVGGGMPTPRKLSAASAKIADAQVQAPHHQQRRDALRGDVADHDPGRRGAPGADRLHVGHRFTLNTTERMIRALPGMRVTAIAMTTV